MCMYFIGFWSHKADKNPLFKFEVNTVLKNLAKPNLIRSVSPEHTAMLKETKAPFPPLPHPAKSLSGRSGNWTAEGGVCAFLPIFDVCRVPGTGCWLSTRQVEFPQRRENWMGQNPQCYPFSRLYLDAAGRALDQIMLT